MSRKKLWNISSLDMMIILFAAVVPVTAQTVIDSLIFIYSDYSSWQTAGIRIQQGDNLYLFGWGSWFASYDWNRHVQGISPVATNAPDTLNQAQPAPGFGRGLVGRIGTTVFSVGEQFIAYAIADTGELYLGVNDYPHTDNWGLLNVGVLVIRGASFRDTALVILGNQGTWFNTTIPVTGGDRVYIVSRGQYLAYTVDIGDIRYAAHNDSAIGNLLVPGLGHGVVGRVGGIAFPVGCFTRIREWQGASGSLELGINDIDPSINNGHLLVGIIVIEDSLPVSEDRSSSVILPELFVKPNPSNAPVEILVTVNGSFECSVAITNTTGSVVRILSGNRLLPGVNRFMWDRRDDRGLLLPSGTYFVALKQGQRIVAEKIVTLK